MVATRAASVAFLAISLMLAPISSAPVATVCTLLADLLGGGRDHVGLGGGLLGVGAHLLADFVQFLGGGNQRGGVGPDLLNGFAHLGGQGIDRRPQASEVAGIFRHHLRREVASGHLVEHLAHILQRSDYRVQRGIHPFYDLAEVAAMFAGIGAGGRVCPRLPPRPAGWHR